MLVIFVFIGAWFLLPFALRKLSEFRLAHLCRKHRAIVLSYDDGPSNTLTPRLLDLLAERKTKATFFVIGKHAANRPEIVTRALEEGHEVGSHSFNHFNAWKVWPRCAARDIVTGIRTVNSLGGDVRLFRPPFGKQTIATLLGSMLQRQSIGWWTVDTADARSDKPRCSVEAVIEQISASGGGVVLAHDFDRPNMVENSMSHNDYVINLTRQVIEFAEKNGFVLMRLGDVLRGGRP